jgi:hypothetical protein
MLTEPTINVAWYLFARVDKDILVEQKMKNT